MQGRNYNLFKGVIGSQYFLYFGVMGIFLPYFNLYCYHIGFSGFQIGVLSAVRSAAMVLFPLLWGVVADRFQTRKLIYISCCFLSSAIWVFFLYTVDFWEILVITIFYGIFYSPIISFLEAFTINLLGIEKKSYGTIRAWGSISFILMVILFGKLIDFFPIRIILFYIFAGSIIQALIAIKIPDIKQKKNKHVLPKKNAMLNRRVIIFLFCAFLMLVSHGTYYGFFSIHLSNAGYDNALIGITWAIASIAEILAMIKSDAIFKKFTLENVLVASFITAALRWLILFFTESFSVIIFSQILHAITYGTFHMASILYIDSLSYEWNKTFGQALNNAVTYGLGMMAGFFLNGYLFEKTGVAWLFFISSITALAGGIIFLAFTISNHRRVK